MNRNFFINTVLSLFFWGFSGWACDIQESSLGIDFIGVHGNATCQENREIQEIEVGPPSNRTLRNVTFYDVHCYTPASEGDGYSAWQVASTAAISFGIGSIIGWGIPKFMGQCTKRIWERWGYESYDPEKPIVTYIPHDARNYGSFQPTVSKLDGHLKKLGYQRNVLFFENNKGYRRLLCCCNKNALLGFRYDHSFPHHPEFPTIEVLFQPKSFRNFYAILVRNDINKKNEDYFFETLESSAIGIQQERIAEELPASVRTVLQNMELDLDTIFSSPLDSRGEVFASLTELERYKRTSHTRDPFMAGFMRESQQKLYYVFGQGEKEGSRIVAGTADVLVTFQFSPPQERQEGSQSRTAIAAPSGSINLEPLSPSSRSSGSRRSQQSTSTTSSSRQSDSSIRQRHSLSSSVSISDTKDE